MNQDPNYTGPVAPLGIAPTLAPPGEAERSGTWPNPPLEPREAMTARPNRTPGPMSYRVPTDGSVYQMILGWTARSVEIVNSSTQVLTLTNDMGDSINCGQGGVVVVPTMPSLRWTAQLQGGASTNGRAAYIFFFAHYRPTLSGSLAGGSAVTVTNFPASAALADATANPTTTLIGSDLELWNGAAWDRMRSAQAQGDAAAGLGMAAVGNWIWNGATWDRAKEAPGADAAAVTGLTAAAGLLWNGATWDRTREVPAADAQGPTGLGAAGALAWNGATWDRLRSFNAIGDAVALATAVMAAGLLGFNGATLDRLRTISGAGAGLGVLQVVSPNATAATVASAANTSVTLTLAAVAGQRNHLRSIDISSNPVTVALVNCLITDNAVTIWSSFAAAGQEPIKAAYFGENGIANVAVNTALTAQCGPGGAGVATEVNATFWVG